ncbi:Urease accessory protein [Rutstroemia sp. NJR-2017a WRK4]|nr:Urease accessory protein [Rutstroemia sp. NJR-2017a WRK4]
MSVETRDLENEVEELERKLRAAKARLRAAQPDSLSSLGNPPNIGALSRPPISQHFLLLLSDSALPLGSFAFSSGLESYLAHTKSISRPSFPDFLEFSLSSYASSTLPFVLAAHRNPLDLVTLDDALDAAIMCTVGRRASIAQGRALLSIWDRSFSSALPAGVEPAVVETLKEFSLLLRSSSSVVTPGEIPPASAHLAPLFGAIAAILGMGLQQTAYVFMLSHVKALLSAAVRASMFGPYHAQKVLASVEVQKGIGECIEREWDTKVEDAGQSVPVMDLWIGRHEMLYSRIFNS